MRKTLLIPVTLACLMAPLALAAAETAQTDAEPATEAVAEEQSIMDLPLDGSSIESFTEGLAKVEAEVSAEEYRELKGALDYLLFYDIGAKRDKATLYKRLNGRTPKQIIAKARR